jgi:hypothetical protein
MYRSFLEIQEKKLTEPYKRNERRPPEIFEARRNCLAALFAIVDFDAFESQTITVVALGHRNKSLLLRNLHKRIPYYTQKMIIPIRCFSCGKVSGCPPHFTSCDALT